MQNYVEHTHRHVRCIHVAGFFRFLRERAVNSSLRHEIVFEGYHLHVQVRGFFVVIVVFIIIIFIIAYAFGKFVCLFGPFENLNARRVSC